MAAMVLSADECAAQLASRLGALVASLDGEATGAALAGSLATATIGAGGAAALVVPKTWAAAEGDAVCVAHTVFLSACNETEAATVKLAICLADGDASPEVASGICDVVERAATSVATAALVLSGDGVGGGAPLRRLARATGRRLLEATRALAEALGAAAPDGRKAAAAARSGVVWEAAAAARELPRSNRAAYRREFLSWAHELKDAVSEFAELVESEGADVDDFDDLHDGFDDAYDDLETPCARAVVDGLGVVGQAYKAVLLKMDAAGSAGDREAAAALFGACGSLRAAATAAAEELYPTLESAGLAAALDTTHAAVARVAALLGEDGAGLLRRWTDKRDAALAALAALP